jgi:L-histidine N-alpha-methyltransferase
MPTSAAPPLTVEVHLGPDELVAALRADVLFGLTATPKELSPTWLYDDLGCELFEQITGLPEYYPTRVERQILRAHGGAIATMTGADTFVELGSGSCEKTRLLLAALADAGSLRHYVPFDVAESTLRSAADAIVGEHPSVRITGIVGDFRHHLAAIPDGGRRLVALLGGTIGNLAPEARASLLDALAATMAPGDTLLLGTDLVKDRSRMLAAYDDAAGVTAAFNRNVLTRLNRELGADFHVDRFEHVARFDARSGWIEMCLRSVGTQHVRIDDLGLNVEFADGEEIRTETSAKFQPARVWAELSAAGFALAGWWTDPDGDYALSLSMR